MTRAEVEAVIIRRCKGYMDRTGLDTVTTDGANDDVNDPIASALAVVGITATDRSSIADADLSALTGNTLEAFLDVAELRTLESLWARLYQVNVSAGPRSESLGALRTDLANYIEARRKAVQATWGSILSVPLFTEGGTARVRAL